MKTQYTFTLVTRSILVLTSLAALASFMFFKDASPLINWLVLSSIIPLIMGMLGENLVRELFTSTVQVHTVKIDLSHRVITPIAA